jgi:DNA (cytosine-5)-methyltransferase 1
MRIVDIGSDGRGTIRKLTEAEHFRLMGFRDGEINFAGQSYTQLCRAAGNGWDVNLVARIFKRIRNLELGEWRDSSNAQQNLALR